jgi:cell division protein FtsQ
MTSDSTNTFGSRAARLGGVGALVAGVVLLGLLGWQWRASAEVERVAVQGTQHAPPDTVRRLARVAPGTPLSAVDPALVADRVARHPWVKTAAVAPEWMFETLSITVTERTPAALAVDGEGRPAYYLSRAGHALPLPDSTGYDVPLVRGLATDGALPPPGRVLGPPVLRTLLATLPTTNAGPLVAEITVRPDRTVRLLTRPMGTHGAVPVRVGTEDVAQRLRTLHAFAQQVLAAQPDASIEEIDLRFDGHVVTREQPTG